MSETSKNFGLASLGGTGFNDFIAWDPFKLVTFLRPYPTNESLYYSPEFLFARVWEQKTRKVNF